MSIKKIMDFSFKLRIGLNSESAQAKPWSQTVGEEIRKQSLAVSFERKHGSAIYCWRLNMMASIREQVDSAARSRNYRQLVLFLPSTTPRDPESFQRRLTGNTTLKVWRQRCGWVKLQSCNLVPCHRMSAPSYLESKQRIEMCHF